MMSRDAREENRFKEEGEREESWYVEGKKIIRVRQRE